MLHIRTMLTEDIPFAIRLSDQEGWGITRNDMQRILRLNPRGSFVAHDETRKLGLATTTSYGKKVAWIGNVIIEKRYRGKRIGRRLVEHAVIYLKKSRIQHIALYCYGQNVGFYENLGFVRDIPFLRMKRTACQVRYPNSQSDFDHKLAFGRLLSVDRKGFGADRSELMCLLTSEENVWCFGISRGLESAAYLVVKRFHNDSELGPWVGTKTNRDDLRSMLRAALAKTCGNPIEVSCLRDNGRALDLLKTHGFRTVTEGYRMYYEERPHIGDDRAQFALGFLDKG
jgi:GNAT superfamily N-acetyltransferase